MVFSLLKIVLIKDYDLSTKSLVMGRRKKSSFFSGKSTNRRGGGDLDFHKLGVSACLLALIFFLFVAVLSRGGGGCQLKKNYFRGFPVLF